MALRAVARGDVSLARARQLPPEAVQALRALADLARRAGRVDLARPLLEGLVALDPRDVWAGLALAELCLGVGDSGAARLAIALVESTERSNGGVRPETALVVGRVLLAERRADEARSWISVAANDARATHAVRSLARALLGREKSR
jgi:DNA-binding SARP family transcriptional activator